MGDGCGPCKHANTCNCVMLAAPAGHCTQYVSVSVPTVSVSLLEVPTVPPSPLCQLTSSLLGTEQCEGFLITVEVGGIVVE